MMSIQSLYFSAVHRLSARPLIRGARRSILFVVILVCVAPLQAQQDFWIGEGADNRWDNPDNWDLGEVPEFGEIRINGPEAEDNNGPLIEDGIDAYAGTLIADAGDPVMTMTGGSLELNGWGTWWGDAPGTTATFNMSGGVIDLVGNPGIMELGWQNEGDPIGSSTGIWNMTDGEIYALGIDMPGKGNGGAGIINLWGGTINVGLSRGGLILYEGALLDITEGELVLEGDQTALVEDYVDQGWVTAFGGDGQLSIEFDGDYTTVTAASAQPGDYNGDGVLNALDIDLQAAEMKKPAAEQDLAKFDHNNDGVIDVGQAGPNEASWGDRLIWIRTLRGTSVGDVNFDEVFDSGDLVLALSGSKYGSGEMATWYEGDWDGDMLFDSGDLVLAFQDGQYVAAASPAAVPEPVSSLMLLVGLIGISVRRRHAAA